MSCNVAFDSAITDTLSAPTIGMRANTSTMLGITATRPTKTPNSAARNVSRLGVGGPAAATTSPPTTAPAPISAVIAARPLAPAPNVNSARSGSVTVNSKVSMPMMTSMISVDRSTGLDQA